MLPAYIYYTVRGIPRKEEFYLARGRATVRDAAFAIARK
jgi:hypothetical protein